ncbi:hypothetical protein ACFL59_00010 [Planctomycetota bacterium]
MHKPRHRSRRIQTDRTAKAHCNDAPSAAEDLTHALLRGIDSWLKILSQVR